MAQGRQDAEAVQAGKSDVEEQEIEFAAGGVVHGRDAVGHHGGRIPRSAQALFDEAGDAFFVFCDEYSDQGDSLEKPGSGGPSGRCGARGSAGALRSRWRACPAGPMVPAPAGRRVPSFAGMDLWCSSRGWPNFVGLRQAAAETISVLSSCSCRGAGANLELWIFRLLTGRGAAAVMASRTGRR